MPDFIQRAAFFEGQVIGADDLNLAVSYERDALARHLRLQHTWGIVSGLELTKAARTTIATSGSKPYVEVTLGTGVAVDGTGRAIVVTEPTRVPDELFEAIGVATPNDPDAYYPVFLEGPDAVAPDTASPTSGCQDAASSRINEAFVISFGRLSEVAKLDTQQTVAVTAGPGGGAPVWKVLLGFVKWDDSIDKFTDVKIQADGVGRRYAGVRAGEVTGIGSQLVMRADERDKGGAPVLQLLGGADNALQFGPQASGGTVAPVMTLDTKGNLTVTGKIVGALAGAVRVETGVATDGMQLPLPSGITQAQIDSGGVVIQSHVTPRFQAPTDFAPAEKWFPHFYECRVEGRRVRCRVRWIRTTGGAGTRDLPGVCDYVLMAFPAK